MCAKFEVVIQYKRGFGGSAILEHCGRCSWSKRQAQRHCADILAGRTGIRMCEVLAVFIREV